MPPFLKYLKRNTVVGLRRSPFRGPYWPWLIFLPFSAFALFAGLSSGLLHVELLQSRVAMALPFTMFVFPALLEELFFRGVLIPVRSLERGWKHALLMVTISTALFVLWHPLNALTINPGALPIFTDPVFLLIVTALGYVCGYAYLLSGSIWVPVILHWLTILGWVFFLGGRNLVAAVFPA